MKKQSNGFTIVELLVCIAIMSILTTVSTISYNSLIKEANIANDISYVKLMNNILDALRVNEGKNDSMSDAINDVYDNSFENFDIKTKNYNIAWLKSKDLFVLLDEKQNIVYPKVINNDSKDLFLLIDDINEIDNSYSYCLTNSYSNEILNITNSIDIGLNSNIKTLNLKCKNDNYYLYTNNEKLNINIYDENNSLASIFHYGKASNVNININKNNKYYEYGSLYSSIDAISIKSGSLIIDNNSNVNDIYINSTDDSLFNITIPYKRTIVYVDDLKIVNDNNITKHDLVIIKLRDIVASNFKENKDYKNINDALADGGSITLLKDIQLAKNETLHISKPMTIDFNGHSVIGENQCNKYSNEVGIFNILSNDVIFTDSSSTNKGIVRNNFGFEGKSYYCTIMLGDKNNNKSNDYSLTINGNLNIDSKCEATISLGYGNCKLIINEAILTSTHYGINFENTNTDSSILINKAIINSRYECFKYKDNKNIEIIEASLTSIKEIKGLINNKNIEMYSNDLYKVVNDIPNNSIARCCILNNNVYLMNGRLEKLINLDEKQNEINIDVFKDCHIDLNGFGNETNSDERILNINVHDNSVIEGKVTLKLATLYINYYLSEKLKIDSDAHFKITKEDNKFISRKE